MDENIKKISKIIEELEGRLKNYASWMERAKLRAEEERIDTIPRARQIELKYHDTLRKKEDMVEEEYERIQREKEEILRKVREGRTLRNRISGITAILSYTIAIPAIITALAIVKVFRFVFSIAERHEWIRRIPVIPILAIISVFIVYLTLTENMRLIQALILLCMIVGLALLPLLFQILPHIYEILSLHSHAFVRKSTGIALIFILFVMIIVGNATFQYSETPEFCLNCHLMKPYYLSYENSPHKEVETCLECHYEPGIIGHIKGKLGGMKSLLQYITGMYEFPIESNISSDLCFRCHYGNESISFDGVKFEHINHETEDCEQCHGVHKKYLPAEMETCIACHEENNVDLDKEECGICHTTGYTTDIKGCIQCHGDMYNETIKFNNLTFTHEHMGDKLPCTSCHRGERHEDYHVGRVEPYCMTCHGKLNINCSTCPQPI